MSDLSTIPAPGPGCTVWRNVSPHGDGYYRRFVGGIQFVYGDGSVLTLVGDDDDR